MSDRNLFTVLDEAATTFGTLPALHQPIPGKSPTTYQTYNWVEYRDIVREIACGLRSLGFVKGDIIALDSETRAEFYLADLGVMSNGSIAAALYTSLPPADRAGNIATCNAKAVFAESPKTMKALQQAGAPEGLTWFLLTGAAEGAMTLADLRARGREALASDPEFFTRITREVGPDDLAVLYVTSGATGQPKMGVTKHSALVSNLDMGPTVLKLTSQDSTLAFLPSAHIAQRVVIELLPIPCGTPVYFSEGLTKMPLELRSVRPTFLLAPPRVWERIFATVSTEIRKKPAVSRKVFYWALGLGLRANRYRHEGKRVPDWITSGLKVADKIVFQQIRARLGGRLRIAASGAAPLGKDLAQFYEAIGLPLIEGYGLTEGGVVAVNPLDAPRPGSIGVMLPGCEMRIAPDGELLLRAPCLFSGYYNDPAATEAVLRDGWLHTGDLAESDKDGYVYITGRKKELIVSSNGKKIYPARIEALLKTDPLINQVVLLGDRQPYVTALFTINTTAAEAIDGSQRGRPMSEVASAPAVLEQVKKTVSKVNKQLAPFEHVKRWKVLERDFSIDSGELTPTMKVRRQQVVQNFRETINELYLGREELV